MEKYDFRKIEEKWSKHWEKESYGQAEDFSDKLKHYHLVEFPYPSGAGLHVGHCMGYGASDAYCRMKRMQGYNIMYPIGWDAFGLPTENYALRTGIHPSVATAQNIAIFKRQIKQLGYAFDWSREINTTDPNYYKWTQWIFLQFYKHGYKGDSPPASWRGTVPGSKLKGQSPLVEVADNDTITPRLAYQQEMPINWCPSCKIGLANEEVVSGACERCGTQTEKRMQKQWLLRITAYADRLIRDLDDVDYLEKIKAQQINWIGRSEGTIVRFDLKSQNHTPPTPPLSKGGIKGGSEKDLFLEVFTTRPDTLFGATFMVIAPEHSLVEEIKDGITNYDDVLHYINDSKKKSDLERTELAREKTGIEILGVKAVNPINGAEIPIFIADYVLPNYGTGAVMAVPAHDERDWEFAKKYDIPIKTVVQPTTAQECWYFNIEPTRYELSANEMAIYNDLIKGSIQPEHYGADSEPKLHAFENNGISINSDFLNGLPTKDAKISITKRLEQYNLGKAAINYKLRDWIFSRQHYWGEPIPIIHCQKCGIVPVPEEDLPIKLPEVERYEPTDTGESPLAKVAEWVNVVCPRCDGPAKRETDTMPNWAGSSWYYLRYCDPKNDKRLASDDKLKYWLHVDIYNGGMEHTTLHLLYSRFWHKFLYDLGTVPTPEPYAKRIAHGIILGPDGQKMSKSRGNVINPDEMIAKFGADTLRVYIMFIGSYDQESAWSMAGIQGVFRFMNRVWHNRTKVDESTIDTNELKIKLHQTIVGVTGDLENFRLNTVVSKLMEFNNTLEKHRSVSNESFGVFLRLLFPVAPHLAAELWAETGQNGTIDKQPWPEADRQLLAAQKITLIIQVNGKYRDSIETGPGISDEKMKQIALSSDKVKTYLGNKEIKRIVIVPKKLINIVA